MTHVPYSPADSCWCQPFDGPRHPLCPMHGDNPPRVESLADRQQKLRQTPFVNVGPKVMQGDHCAAVACSSSMAKTIAIALNNRREARSKTHGS